MKLLSSNILKQIVHFHSSYPLITNPRTFRVVFNNSSIQYVSRCLRLQFFISRSTHVVHRKFVKKLIFSGCCFSQCSKLCGDYQAVDAENLVSDPVFHFEDTSHSTMLHSTSTDATSQSNLSPENENPPIPDPGNKNASSSSVSVEEMAKFVEDLVDTTCKNETFLIKTVMGVGNEFTESQSPKEDSLNGGNDLKRTSDEDILVESEDDGPRLKKQAHTVGNCLLVEVPTTNLNKRTFETDKQEADKLPTVEIEPPASKIRKNKRGDKQGQDEDHPPKLRPNYFLAFKVSEPEILQNIGEVQQHIIKKDKRLERCAIALPTLHITFMTMQINDNREYLRALNVLKDIYDQYKDALSADPMVLEFSGIGHFNNKVIFSKIAQSDSLTRLTAFAKHIIEHFVANGIPSTDPSPKFLPHLTLMKLSKDPSVFRKGVRKINPLFYTEFKDQYFGVQVVKGVQLLSMTEPKGEDGYYPGEEFLFDIKEHTMMA